jgi:hypothetical protein
MVASQVDGLSWRPVARGTVQCPTQRQFPKHDTRASDLRFYIAARAFRNLECGNQVNFFGTAALTWEARRKCDPHHDGVHDRIAAASKP